MNDDAKLCQRCNGEGQRIQYDHDNANSHIIVLCRWCKGTGQGPDENWIMDEA